MDRWLQQVAGELGVDPDVPVDALLEAARVVAHTVERKATPLTTYLIGVAAGRSAGVDVDEICRRVIGLAQGWETNGWDGAGRDGEKPDADGSRG